MTAEIDVFPVEFISSNLLPLIAEKFTYMDFSTFNECNKRTAAVCESVKESVIIHLHVYKINVGGESDGGIHFSRESEAAFPLNNIPYRLHFSCEELFIHSSSGIEEIRKYGITADFASTSYCIMNPMETKKIILLARPKRFSLFANADALSAEEFRTVPSLDITCTSLVPEEIVLSWKSPGLTVEMITAQRFNHTLLVQILKQWMNGEREITRVAVQFGEIDLKWLQLEMGENCRRKEGQNDEEPLFVYRRQGEECVEVTIMGEIIKLFC